MVYTERLVEFRFDAGKLVREIWDYSWRQSSIRVELQLAFQSAQFAALKVMKVNLTGWGFPLNKHAQKCFHLRLVTFSIH